MNTTPVHYTKLYDRNDRTTAHFAAAARRDTIFGGATALVLAKRLQRMNPRSDALNVVHDVYSASTGKHHCDHEAWECPECGSVHLGKESAFKCCAEN